MTLVKRVLAGLVFLAASLGDVAGVNIWTGLGAPPGSPGAYTAIMSGVDNTTGVGIVEVFAVP